MSNPKLLTEAEAGKARFFLQFGGQGAPWLKEVGDYYHNDPAVRKIIEVCLKAVEEEADNVSGTVGLPEGIDARKWVEDPESVPSAEYIGSAAVSIPMIQMTQLAHFEFLGTQGYELSRLVAASAGAAGHSQGLIPASLVAMDLKGDDYLEAVSKYMKYLLYLGVRGQETFPYFEPTAEEIERSLAVGGPKAIPTPMVAFLGTDQATTEKLVAETNAELPADKQIYISLQNSPTNRILSSYRGSLIKFNEMHKAYMDENKLKFVYIRTTCPFHSPLMEKVREPFEADIKRIGFPYKGSDLKIPVWSFFEGRNMQEDDELAYTMYKDMAINALYWEKSVSPVSKDSSITHVIDYGPGKASQRLTSDTLAELGCSTPVLGVANAKDRKLLLEA